MFIHSKDISLLSQVPLRPFGQVHVATQLQAVRPREVPQHDGPATLARPMTREREGLRTTISPAPSLTIETVENFESKWVRFVKIRAHRCSKTLNS